MRKIQTLDFIIQEDGFIPDFTQYRDERFFPDQYMGMYLIVLRNDKCQSSPSFDFLKNLTSVFFFQLQRTPSLELKREKIEVQYDLLEIDELISWEDDEVLMSVCGKNVLPSSKAANVHNRWRSSRRL